MAFYSGDDIYKPKQQWDRHFSLFPRKCGRSGKSLWFKWGYRLRDYPDVTWPDDFWISEQEYTWMLLKQD